MRTRAVLTTAVTLTAGALLLTACGSDTDRALADATRAARTDARAVQAAFQAVVDAPDAPRGQALLAEVGSGSGSPRFTASALRPDGSVVVDLHFDEQDQRGGGLSYVGVLVRLCVRCTVVPGSPVTLSDTPCPATLVNPSGPTPRADAIITLDD